MGKRKRQKKQSVLDGATGAPDGLRELMAGYLEALRVRNYSAASVETYETGLISLATWCEERGLLRAAEVTRPILERYQRHLFYYRKSNGQALSVRTQHTLVSALRGFFRWLARERHVLNNPASELLLPRLHKQLPKVVLTAEQAEVVLGLPDVATTLGLRDKAVLEALYSTGLRRRELASLCVWDIDASRGTVAVREGKGGKDRFVPIGERALAWLTKYLDTSRPRLVVESDAGVLFLSAYGVPFSPDELTHLAAGYVRASGVAKTGACHLFRHSMATAMLEGGADIRFIQQMLGHAKLDTTELYTRVSIQKLKEIHSATHPAAKLGRKAGAASENSGGAEGLSESERREQLLSALAAEGDEEARGGAE